MRAARHPARAAAHLARWPSSPSCRARWTWTPAASVAGIARRAVHLRSRSADRRLDQAGHPRRSTKRFACSTHAARRLGRHQPADRRRSGGAVVQAGPWTRRSSATFIDAISRGPRGGSRHPASAAADRRAAARSQRRPGSRRPQSRRRRTRPPDGRLVNVEGQLRDMRQTLSERAKEAAPLPDYREAVELHRRRSRWSRGFSRPMRNRWKRLPRRSSSAATPPARSNRAKRRSPLTAAS